MTINYRLSISPLSKCDQLSRDLGVRLNSCAGVGFPLFWNVLCFVFFLFYVVVTVGRHIGLWSEV